MNPGERVALGDTGVQVTRLGQGTGPLGNFRDDGHWKDVVDAAWGHGVRFFDTSPFYGLGNSEERLGRQLRERPRDEFALSTKVGRLLRTEGPIEDFERDIFYPDGVPEGAPRGRYDYSRSGALESLRTSYERLGLDRVDIVHVHDIIEMTSGQSHKDEVIAETVPALVELRDRGEIRAVGIGVQVNELLRDIGDATDIDACLLAGRYTLLDQESLDEALPVAERNGISIIVGSPYQTGILYDPRPGCTFDFFPATDAQIAKAQAIKAVCDRYGVPLPAAAIQFPFGHPQVVAVLTGAVRASETDENARLMQVDIPEALWHELQDGGLVRRDAPLPCERPASAPEGSAR